MPGRNGCWGRGQWGKKSGDICNSFNNIDKFLKFNKRSLILSRIVLNVRYIELNINRKIIPDFQMFLFALQFLLEHKAISYVYTHRPRWQLGSCLYGEYSANLNLCLFS